MPLTPLAVSDKHDLSVLSNRSSASPLMETSTSDCYMKQMTYPSYSLDTALLFKDSPAAAFIKKYAPKRSSTIDNYAHTLGRKKTRKSICYSSHSHSLIDLMMSNKHTKYGKSRIASHATTPLRVKQVSLPQNYEKSAPLHESNTNYYHDSAWQNICDQHFTDSGISSQETNKNTILSTPEDIYSNKHQLSSVDVEFKRSPQLKNDLLQHLRIEKCIRQLRSRLALAMHKSFTGQYSKSFDELIAQYTTHSSACMQGVTRDATNCTAQVVEDEFGRCILQPCRALSSTLALTTHTDTDDHNADTDANADVQLLHPIHAVHPSPPHRTTATTNDRMMTTCLTSSSRLMQSLQMRRRHHLHYYRRRVLNTVTPLIPRRSSRSACYKSATVAAYFATPCVALSQPTSPYESMLKRRTKKTREASSMNTADKLLQLDTTIPTTSHHCEPSSTVNTINVDETVDTVISDSNDAFINTQIADNDYHHRQYRSASSISTMKQSEHHNNINDNPIVTPNMSPLDCAAAAEAMLLLHQQDN